MCVRRARTVCACDTITNVRVRGSDVNHHYMLIFRKMCCGCFCRCGPSWQVESLTSNVSALADAVAALLQATTFASTNTDTESDTTSPVSEGCGGGSVASSNSPCDTTVTDAPSVTSTSAPSQRQHVDVVDISICYSYGCDEEAEPAALAWDRALFLSAAVRNASLVTSETVFYWSLVPADTNASSAGAVWNASSATRFADLTGSEVPVSPALQYNLTLYVHFSDTDITRALVSTLRYIHARTYTRTHSSSRVCCE